MKNIIIVLIMLFAGSCTSPYQVDTEDIVKYEEAYYGAYSKGQYNDAINLFRVIIDEYPWSSKVDNSWYYTGRSYEELNDTTNAINAFENIPSKSSQYDEAQKRIINLGGGK